MKFLLTLGAGIYIGYSMREKKEDPNGLIQFVRPGVQSFVSTLKDVTADALEDRLRSSK